MFKTEKYHSLMQCIMHACNFIRIYCLAQQSKIEMFFKDSRIQETDSQIATKFLKYITVLSNSRVI